MLRKAVTGTFLATALLLQSVAPASAASPHGFVDHPLYSKDGAAYKWAESDLYDAIGLDLFTGYSNGTMLVDLAKPFRTEPTAPKVDYYVNMPAVEKEVPTWPEFRPGNPITRAEFATILARATGLEAGYRTGVGAPFRDTPREAWYQQYLSPLYDQNVVRLDDYYLDELRPNEPITRAEIAAWSARALHAKGMVVAGAPLDFSDIPNRYQYETELKQAVQLGIIRGYPDGTFGPDRTATRAEAAVMTMRTVRQLKSASTSTAEAVATLQATIQNGHDAHTLYMRDRPNEQIPNPADFSRYMRRYYTQSVVDLRANPQATTDNCKGIPFTFDPRFSRLREYQSKDGLLCLSQSAGMGDMLATSLTENFMRNRLEGVQSYTTFDVQAVEPVVINDRYAIVTVKGVYQTAAGTMNFNPFISTQRYYLRVEDGRWKVSGMGARTGELTKAYYKPLNARLKDKTLADH